MQRSLNRLPLKRLDSAYKAAGECVQCTALTGTCTHCPWSAVYVPCLQAFRKLEEMAGRHADKLRRLTKQVQEAKQSHDDEEVKRRVEEYDDTLEK